MLTFEARPCWFVLSATLLGTTACGGRAQEADKSRGQDSGLEMPHGCTVDGQHLAEGQSTASSDGCNSCACKAGQLLCSQSPCPADQLCKDQICYPPGSCLMDGNLVAPDETIVAPDGCNTCTCVSGQVNCTSKPCGTGCHAPAPDDEQDCADGESVEIHWYDGDIGDCRQKTVNRCSTTALMDGYFHSYVECAAACPYDEGLGCVVGGELYPHGSGFTDPFSCNGCTCQNGGFGGCSQGACEKPCPEGTAPGAQCGICGQAGVCEAIEIACLPVCGTDTAQPCVSGGCIEGLCVTACQ